MIDDVYYASGSEEGLIARSLYTGKGCRGFCASQCVRMRESHEYMQQRQQQQKSAAGRKKAPRW